MAVISLRRIWDQASSGFWLVPSACVTVSAAAGVGLARLDRGAGNKSPQYLFPGPPEGARSFLGAIIGAMISFTGLVFSITIVVLVLTSGQFSPRVLRGFLRDRVIQWSLGLFVSTFVYAMVVDREVLGTHTTGPFVPRIAVTAAFVLVLVSVGLFIFYIDHVANMIRVSSIIANVGRESRTLLERRYPQDPDDPPPMPALRPVTTVVDANKMGVIVSVNTGALVDICRELDVVAELVPRIGDFVPKDGPLVRVHGDPGDGGHRLLRHISLANERTTEQDLAFGFRQLVDIAEKALSPGINDPTTAVQVIDTLHDLLRRLAVRELPPGRFADSHDDVRLIMPDYRFPDYLDVAVTEIWHFGKDSTQIPERLQRMLHDLLSAARPEYRSSISHWLRRVGGAVPATVIAS